MDYDMLKYDTILFDLDGTLLDTLDDLADSVNTVMKEEGYPLRTRDEIRKFVGNGVKMLMARALPNGTSEQEVLRCLALFREIYLKNMRNQTKPYSGIPELLKELKKMGIKIGVVSNKLDEATKEMCRMYFGSDVDAAIGDSQERRKKPAPDNVLEALRQLNSSKEKTLYVGDSDVDMETAKNAGLASVGVTWGFRSKEVLEAGGADHIIQDPDQFLPLFIELTTG